MLKADGKTVFSYGVEAEQADRESARTEGENELEAALGAETVLLPLPLCGADGLLNCSGRPLPMTEVFSRLSRSQILLAGQVPPEWAREARRRNLDLTDLLAREELAIANASATAEAAIQVTMDHLEETLAGKRCLVLGFGRIGKLLCPRLRGLSALVSAAARRREDRAWIRAYGYPALDTGALSGNLARFDVIYNTAPALLLDKSLLAEVSPSCLLIELASRPGIDVSAADALGLRVIAARGLPGRLVPRSAAALIREEVYEILREKRGGSS